MQESKSNQAHAKARGPRRRIFTAAVTFVGATGLAAAVILPAGSALAAYQAVTPDGSAVASVTVGSAISLTNLTPTFTLGLGVPGDLLTGTPAAVTLNVYTNNATGYNVTVQATTDLTNGSAAPHASTDTIPAADLSVEDNDAANTATDKGAYVPISAATTLGNPGPLVAYDQTTRSAAGVGDLLTESWELNTAIPDVNDGTYSATIDFIASNNI